MSYHDRSTAFEQKHKDTVARKHDEIGMLKAILDMWEKRDDRDDAYLLDVRRRLHSKENQLKNMKDW